MVLFVYFSVGIAKAVQSYQGGSIVPTTLELLCGVVFGLPYVPTTSGLCLTSWPCSRLMWLGFCESEHRSHWFFARDLFEDAVNIAILLFDLCTLTNIALQRFCLTLELMQRAVKIFESSSIPQLVQLYVITVPIIQQLRRNCTPIKITLTSFLQQHPHYQSLSRTKKLRVPWAVDANSIMMQV